MERDTLWYTSGLCVGSYTFLLYINNLPKLICDLSKPILFVDDINTIILDKNATNFKIKTNYLR
jgi:hypothetical protein